MQIPVSYGAKSCRTRLRYGCVVPPDDQMSASQTRFEIPLSTASTPKYSPMQVILILYAWMLIARRG